MSAKSGIDTIKYYTCPSTSGIDAFAHIWVGENSWLVPPPRLISLWVLEIPGNFFDDG